MRTVYTDIASGIIDKLCFKSFDVPFAKGLGPSLRIREWELLKLGVKKIMDEHNGVVTSAMLTEEGISRLYLKQLRDRGELEFVSRGIYVSSNAFEDEMYILQCKYSKGIFSHETALYIHGYSDRTPSKYTMTFNYGYHSASLKTENAMQLKAFIKNKAVEKNISAQLVMQNYEKITANVLNSEQMQGFWTKYRKDFDYASDITFEDVCKTVITIFKQLSL